jgi:SOS-response transcriptional repressor LexA
MSIGYFINSGKFDMNIRKLIGQRIQSARTDKGLTQAKLAELAGDFKQPRVNNWERGIRIPGPEEIKQLAQVLDVSPAFLMCLSDEKGSGHTKKVTRIPLLNHRQASNATACIEMLRENPQQNTFFIAVSSEQLPELNVNAFALKMLDESMVPEIRINDIQVIDPSVVPKPGDFVVVKVSGNPDTIICQYKKLSYSSSDFELLTLNDNWPNIKTNENIDVEIIGKVVQNIRNY